MDAARRREPLEDAAIDALGALRDDRAADFLTEFLKHGSQQQQRAAAQALARLSPEAAEEPLIAAMETQDADLRRVVVEALGALGPPRIEVGVHAGSDADAY
jgi:HEAT repeat protein